MDSGGGWLIFALPPTELGVHPVTGTSRRSGRQELYFMCHDIGSTVEELRAKGVEFTTDIADQGFGLVIRFTVPGAGAAWLYEPKHVSPLAEFS